MTCEFNTNNRKSFDIELRKGVKEIRKLKDEEARKEALLKLYSPSVTFGSGYCRIREFEIEIAPYTYCANHDYRNPEHHNVPVGPAFAGDSFHNRWATKLSPDNPVIRERLLHLISEINMTPRAEYRPGYSMWEMAIYQLGVFRERQAVPELERIAALPLETFHSDEDEHASRNPLIYLARWALKIMDTPPEEIIDKEFETTVEKVKYPGDPTTTGK
jgi:hypothetical protein